MENQIKIEYVKLETLKPSEYNPREITDKQLEAICRSIVEFGIVDPFIARREDGLIIGGHMRMKAVEKLQSGPFTYRGKDGKRVTVRWTAPSQGVPVVFLDDVSDSRAKLLNLALNKATGDWDHEALGNLFKDLSDEFDIDELTVSAFSPAEITDYIDLPPIDGDGELPRPTTKAPSIALDFSTAVLRDAVKAKIASAAKEERDDMPSGDILAKMLGVRGRRK